MTRLEARKVVALMLVSKHGEADLRIVDSILDVWAHDAHDNGVLASEAFDITLSEDCLDVDQLLQGDLSCLAHPRAGYYTLMEYRVAEEAMRGELC